jgi:hypothetical protein
MMGYMADRQALLNSGTDVGLDAILRLVQASFSGPLGAVSTFYTNLADGPNPGLRLATLCPNQQDMRVRQP